MKVLCQQWTRPSEGFEITEWTRPSKGFKDTDWWTEDPRVDLTRVRERLVPTGDTMTNCRQ